MSWEEFKVGAVTLFFGICFLILEWSMLGLSDYFFG
jgi:hypothetical protein